MSLIQGQSGVSSNRPLIGVNPKKGRDFVGRLYTPKSDSSSRQVAQDSLNQPTVSNRQRRIKARKEKRAKKAAFYKVFDKCSRIWAEGNLDLSRATVKKAVKVALSVFLESTSGASIYHAETDFFVSRPETDGVPEISFRGRLLGTGGFGIVHKVFMVALGDFAALKEPRKYEDSELSETLRSDKRDGAVNDLINEARILQALGVADGVQKPPYEVIDFHQDGGDHIVGYMGHQYNGDMNSIRPENRAERVSVAWQLITGLITIHGHDLRHGDIKPGNIFMDKPELGDSGEYRAYIADLGGARYFSDIKADFDRYSNRFQQLPKDRQSTLVLLRFASFLIGGHTKSFNSRRKTQRGAEFLSDQMAIARSIRDGDFNMYKGIERARDVYSLGLSLVVALGFKSEVPESHFNNLIEHLIDHETLHQDVKDALSSNGLNSRQIDILNKTLSDKWRERPSLEQLLNEFPKP